MKQCKIMCQFELDIGGSTGQREVMSSPLRHLNSKVNTEN